eukprot:3675900-Rhodomonas_salina.1
MAPVTCFGSGREGFLRACSLAPLGPAIVGGVLWCARHVILTSVLISLRQRAVTDSECSNRFKLVAAASVAVSVQRPPSILPAVLAITQAITMSIKSTSLAGQLEVRFHHDSDRHGPARTSLAGQPASASSSHVTVTVGHSLRLAVTQTQ